MFGIFPQVFSKVFTTVVNNTDLINDIVDNMLNSDVINDMINNLENMVNLNVDFKEYKRKYLIDADLPGIEKKDITIDYDNNYISISIKRDKICTTSKNIAVTVIQQGNDLSKDFYVENINPYNIKAVFKDEHLQVYIPKNNKIKEISTVVEVDNYTCK